MATPSPTVFESTSRMGFLSLVSPNRRLPVPRTTGKTISRTSSAQLRPSRLQAAPLGEAAGWLESYRRFWEGSFDRLEARLRAAKKEAEDD
jgi:hypothetical protein